MKYEIQKRIELTSASEDEILFISREAQTMKETCDRRLKEAIPILEQSVSGINRISKVEIDEIKSFVKPSKPIVDLMTAVCIILRIEPIVTKDHKTVTEDYWTAALSNKCLSNPHIIHLLSTVDPLSLNQEVMQSLETFLEESKLEIETVKRACNASESIYNWVLAVRNYYYVYKTTEPLRDKMV